MLVDRAAGTRLSVVANSSAQKEVSEHSSAAQILAFSNVSMTGGLFIRFLDSISWTGMHRSASRAHVGPAASIRLAQQLHPIFDEIGMRYSRQLGLHTTSRESS